MKKSLFFDLPLTHFPWYWYAITIIIIIISPNFKVPINEMAISCRCNSHLTFGTSNGGIKSSRNQNQIRIELIGQRHQNLLKNCHIISITKSKFIQRNIYIFSSRCKQRGQINLKKMFVVI